MFRKLLAFLVITMLLLAACGGGGTTPTSVPANQGGDETEEAVGEATDEAEMEETEAAGEEEGTDEPTEEAAEEEGAEEVAEGEIPVPLGDAEAGAEHFNQMREEVGFACVTCHRVDSEETLVGPGLQGIATRAAERVEDQTAAQYLYTSIVSPDAHVVEGFADNLMPETYGELWSEEELGDLVAYLLTL